MISTLDVGVLFDTYPELFEKFNGAFDIGPGWFKLIQDLCPPLNQYGDMIKNVSKVNILNVKKKFGILHIDHSGGDQFTAKMIHTAERFSYRICEECGNKGTLCSSDGTPYGTLATLCDKDSLVKFRKIYDVPTIHNRRLFA